MPFSTSAPPADMGPDPRARHRVRRILFACLSALAAIAALAGLASGALSISASEILHILSHPGDASSGTGASVIWNLRIPRVLLALLVGASLAASGAAMQGLFRNPLADPGLVGVASGAALAAVAAIIFARGLALPAALLPYLTPIAAFTGGLAAAGLAAKLASFEGQTRTATLLLAGLAINAIAGAGIGLMIQLAGDTALREATFWLFGSLGKAGWPELAAAAPILILSLVLLPRQARALNALLLGEAEAAHLGVNVEALKRKVTALIVLSVAISVALAGVIGFVGLIVPHLIRLTIGPDHRYLIPGAALGGAALLLCADLAARSWMAPAEMPIGILTALVGGPFFLGMLIHFRRRIELF